MKSKRIRGIFLIIVSLFFSSCSDFLSQSVEKVNSDVVDEDYVKFYAQFPKTRTLGIQWNKYRDINNDPVPVMPAAVSVHDVSVCDPCVIKLGEHDYRMWYTRIELIDAGGGITRKIYSIRYAESSDGIGWTDYTADTAVPGITIDNELAGVRVCTLIKTDNPVHTFRMLYLGKSDLDNDTGWKLYYAYTDSITDRGSVTWKTERFGELYQALDLSLGDFDSTNISRAYVLKDRQGGYKMWYGGYKLSTGKIGFATSQDGKYKWTKKYGIMSPGFASKNSFDTVSIDYSCVIKDDGIYKMWYSGKNSPWSIGLAYSLDGQNFVYYDEQFDSAGNNAVLQPEFFWEGRGIFNCWILNDSDEDGNRVYKIWYTAEGNDGIYRIGYAESY